MSLSRGRDRRLFVRDKPMTCPECNSLYMSNGDEEHFPSCEDCGFVQYDADTLALMAEVRREQAHAKSVLGYVPTYQEAVENGLAK